MCLALLLLLVHFSTTTCVEISSTSVIVEFDPAAFQAAVAAEEVDSVSVAQVTSTVQQQHVPVATKEDSQHTIQQQQWRQGESRKGNKTQQGFSRQGRATGGSGAAAARRASALARAPAAARLTRRLLERAAAARIRVRASQPYGVVFHGAAVEAASESDAAALRELLSSSPSVASVYPVVRAAHHYCCCCCTPLLLLLLLLQLAVRAACAVQ